MPAFPERPTGRQPAGWLPWGLAGAAAAALGVVAVTAWRAADRQRLDGEGALRQAATEAASGLAAQLHLLFAHEERSGFSNTISARTEWFTSPGHADDWVFGPWPQPASELEPWLQQLRTLRLEGKTDKAVELINNPSNPLGNWLTLFQRDLNEKSFGSSFANSVRAAQPSPGLAGTTSSGLPLGPLILREVMLLETYPAAKSRLAARTWEAAATIPSALTSRLVEESAQVFEAILPDVDSTDPGSFPPQTKEIQLAGLRKSLAAARSRAGELDGLRGILTNNREKIINRQPWLDGTWHCAYPGDGTIKLRSLGDLQHFAREKGTPPGSVLTRDGWRAHITLDEVKLAGDIISSGKRLGSASHGPWKVEVFSHGADPFALLEEQLVRQRWLIAGAAGSIGAALGGFLLVLARQRRVNAMMSNFVASVSHELRAPIGSIGLLAERLGTGRIADAEEQARYHQLIRGECRRLSGTIENVLSFSRGERGQASHELELSDLTALVRDTADLLRPLAEERGVTLLTTLPDAPLECEINPSAIRQAVLNLLDNALKFSPPGGTIRLSLTEAGGEAVITVSDEGPGVPPAERGRIFEPFYRIGNELRRETPGIGIGLAIVRQAALAHGGSVAVRDGMDRIPGKTTGAVFELRLQKTPLRHQNLKPET